MQKKKRAQGTKTLNTITLLTLSGCADLRKQDRQEAKRKQALNNRHSLHVRTGRQNKRKEITQVPGNVWNNSLSKKTIYCVYNENGQQMNNA